MINRELIKTCIEPFDLLNDLGHELRPDGAHYRGPCPMCGGSTTATKFVVTDELWHCKACGKGGDVIQLYMNIFNCGFASACAQLATRFGITGEISLSDLKNIYKQRHTKKTDYLSAQKLNTEHAQETWKNLDTTCPEGESYLYKRGIINGQSFGVKYSGFAVCLPLYDLEGEIINVVARLLNPTDKKVLGLKGCSGMGTLGDYSLFANQEQLKVIITEGVFDYLSARQLHYEKDVCVLGVHGASSMPKIVAGLCSTKMIGCLTFYQQTDNAGKAAVNKSIQVAYNWNVETELLECGGYQDLNDMLTGGNND